MDYTQQLHYYYQHIYPSTLIHKFIRSTPNREISCTLSSNTYIRYLSFQNPSNLIAFLTKKVPIKLDIGCIYTSRPDTAIVSVDLIPDRKELVFDIDLTDYDRTCCVGKTICNLCLEYAKCGGRILDIFMRQIFGFNKIMYAFSGNRGIHVYVCDDEAMCLDNMARKAIVDFINIGNGRKIEDVKNVIEKYKENEKDDVWSKMFVRVDRNVSVDIKHLLKAPFSVHPTSKKVSVPMSLKMLEDFDISKMVDIQALIENKELIDDYINYFAEFIDKL